MAPKYEIRQDDLSRLDNDFCYHPPANGQVQRYALIRAEGKSFAATILGQCPPGRERSLALTKIEEAVMWCNAGIARNE